MSAIEELKAHVAKGGDPAYSQRVMSDSGELRAILELDARLAAVEAWKSRDEVAAREFADGMRKVDEPDR